MIVDHEEHLRIHNLGPCALSGLPDERIVDAPAGCEGEGEGEEPETFAEHHVALKPEAKTQDAEPRKKKRRRGKRGGKGRSGAAQQQQTEQSEREAEDQRPGQTHGPERPKAHASATTRPLAAIRLTTRPRPNPSKTSKPRPPRATRRLKSTSAAGAASARRTAARRRTKMHPSPKRATKTATRNNTKPHPKKACRPTARPTERKPPNAGARAKNDDGEAKPERTVDWAASRTHLDESLDAFLKTVQADNAEHTVDEKEASKAAKPVYRALKPFLTCPDAVAAFDAALGGIRTNNASLRDSDAEIPAPVHSMLGTLHQVVKDCVKRISAEGDAVETACLQGAARRRGLQAAVQKDRSRAQIPPVHLGRRFSQRNGIEAGIAQGPMRYPWP